MALISTTAIPGPAPGPAGAGPAAAPTAESAGTGASVIPPCLIAAGTSAIGCVLLAHFLKIKCIHSLCLWSSTISEKTNSNVIGNYYEGIHCE